MSLNSYVLLYVLELPVIEILLLVLKFTTTLCYTEIYYLLFILSLLLLVVLLSFTTSY